MQNYLLRVSVGISDEDPESIDAMQEVITSAARDIAIKASLLGLYDDLLRISLTLVPVIGAPKELSLDPPETEEMEEQLPTVSELTQGE